MKHIQLTLVLLFLFSSLFSQENNYNSQRILNSEVDTINGIQFIPLNALEGKYDVLITGIEFDTLNIVKKKAIEIKWYSINITGTYYIIITPRQIYLRSGHENPNPNFLFWITDVTSAQYEILKNYLYNNTNRKLDDCTIEGSYYKSFFYNNYRKEKFRKGEWTDMQYKNFISILKLINRAFKSKEMCIEIPDYNNFNKIKPLLLVNDLRELDGQVKIMKLE